jgi:hypothetical protein
MSFQVELELGPMKEVLPQARDFTRHSVELKCYSPCVLEGCGWGGILTSIVLMV